MSTKNKKHEPNAPSIGGPTNKDSSMQNDPGLGNPYNHEPVNSGEGEKDASGHEIDLKPVSTAADETGGFFTDDANRVNQDHKENPMMDLSGANKEPKVDQGLDAKESEILDPLVGEIDPSQTKKINDPEKAEKEVPKQDGPGMGTFAGPGGDTNEETRVEQGTAPTENDIDSLREKALNKDLGENKTEGTFGPPADLGPVPPAISSEEEKRKELAMLLSNRKNPDIGLSDDEELRLAELQGEFGVEAHEEEKEHAKRLEEFVPTDFKVIENIYSKKTFEKRDGDTVTTVELNFLHGEDDQWTVTVRSFGKSKDRFAELMESLD